MLKYFPIFNNLKIGFAWWHLAATMRFNIQLDLLDICWKDFQVLLVDGNNWVNNKKLGNIRFTLILICTCIIFVIDRGISIEKLK